MAEARVLRPVPTDRAPDDVASALSRFDDWFYDFSFSNGASTSAPDRMTSEIHSTRAELIFPLLDEAYGSRWPDLSCLDLACHQGWFAFQLAARGARDVLGIDVRPRHVELASEVQALSTLGNIRFRCANLFQLAGSGVGPCDLTLFLGILYHLDNPLEALRLLRSLTRRVAVVETQVARPAPELTCLWGSDQRERRGPAIALVESDATHVEGDTGLVLVPTLSALYAMLNAAGFARLHLAIPRPDMNEQYVRCERVVILAT